MAMAVAIDTSRLALEVIPRWQRKLDELVGGDGRRFQIYMASVYGTILSSDSEIYRQLYSQNSSLRYTTDEDRQRVFETNAKDEALDWQADPDDDLGDEAVFRNLHQQAATVPALSSVISRSDRVKVASTLTGSVLAASINARTQGRLLSSFHRYSYRLTRFAPGVPIFGIASVNQETDMSKLFPCGVRDDLISMMRSDPSRLIIWAGPKTDNYVVFWQVQVDVVDLFGRRFPTSRPRKRQRTAFNQFGQLSQSPVGKRFNGVRYRTDRNIWVAEMKPPKHRTKQDFGNFNSEVVAARAVDAAYHHYGRPELLNFPHTSLQFLSKRPTPPGGLDQKAKVKFVREEARLLLKATAASSPLHSTHTTSTSHQIPELSASPSRRPPGSFCSLSETSSPLSFSGPDDVDAVVSQPQPWMLHDTFCEISTTGDFETVNSVGNAEQEWDSAEDSCTLAAPPNVLNPSTSESPSMWLDSILRSSPAPTFPRSPSPSHFQDEIALALLEHQSI